MAKPSAVAGNLKDWEGGEGCHGWGQIVPCGETARTWQHYFVSVSSGRNGSGRRRIGGSRERNGNLRIWKRGEGRGGGGGGCKGDDKYDSPVTDCENVTSCLFPQEGHTVGAQVIAAAVNETAIIAEIKNKRIILWTNAAYWLNGQRTELRNKQGNKPPKSTNMFSYSGMLSNTNLRNKTNPRRTKNATPEWSRKVREVTENQKRSSHGDEDTISAIRNGYTAVHTVRSEGGVNGSSDSRTFSWQRTLAINTKNASCFCTTLGKQCSTYLKT